MKSRTVCLSGIAGLAACTVFALTSAAVAGGLPNDLCDNAIGIGLGDTAYSNVGATTDGPNPTPCGPNLNQDIWFSFDAEELDVLIVSTCGQVNYDSYLAVYSGTCGALLFEACNDDAPGCGLSSRLEVLTFPGTTYLIRVGSWGGGSGSGTLTLSYGLPPGPDNNACADAVPIDLGDTAFSTVGATTDGPNPTACGSNNQDIWFTYSAAETSTLIVSTCNQATYDTFLSAYTGSCGALTEIACNDDSAGCAAFSSVMAVAVQAGQDYLIRVGGFGGGAGSGTLSLSICDVTCPRGAQQEAEDCGDDTNGGCNLSFASDCCTPNPFPGCEDAGCTEIVCAFDPFCCDTAWDAICAGIAQDACGEICEAEALFEDISCGVTICGTAWADGGTRDTDWFRFELAEATTVRLTGSANFPLLIGIVNNGGVDDCAGVTAFLGFTTVAACSTGSVDICAPAGTVWVFVGASTFAGLPCGSTNDYVLTVECLESCALPNDDCADALPITLGDTSFTTLGASTDGPALPAECEKGFGLSFVNDVWYEYVATETDFLTVSTCNQANFDTRLAAYTGACDNLFLVACNDDGPACAGFTSLMEVLTFKGESYLIRVGGFGGAGSGTLSLFYGAAPGLPNDDCADAIVVTDGVTAFSTVGATTDGPDLPAECDEGFGLSFVNDVWYLYTPTCDGIVTFTTCDSATFDTRLAAYTGDCGSLTLVACNDDGPGCSGFTSTLEWQGECGVTYLVRLGGFSGFGSGSFTVFCDGNSCDGPPACVGDLNNSGAVDGGDLGILLAQWGPCPGCSGDLNGDDQVDGTDLGILLANWGDCPNG